MKAEEATKVHDAIVEWIKEDSREEAFEIMSLATDEETAEFLKYSDANEGNVMCLVLDTIKNRLVMDGDMRQSEWTSFGNKEVVVSLAAIALSDARDILEKHANPAGMTIGFDEERYELTGAEMASIAKAVYLAELELDK